MLSQRRMWKRGLLLAALAAPLLGVAVAQIVSRSDERVEAQDTAGDLAFFAGRELTIATKSSDDIFAAGREVALTGAQADHMIVGGGEIVVTDSAFADLIGAGGDVDLISGAVADDVVMAGRELSFRREFAIGGAAVVAGGEITIDSPIGGELRAAARRLTVNGSVTGDAHLQGAEIIIGPTARIGGSLHHHGRTVAIDPGAVVTGEIIALDPGPHPKAQEWGVKAITAIAIFALAFLIGVGVLVVIIAMVLPALMNSAASMIRQRPLSTLGIGFLIAIAAPVVIAILFATVFGAPLALLIMAIYAAACPLAIAAFAYFIGMAARGATRKSPAPAPGLLERALWTTIAAGLLVVIGIIPFVGGLVWLVAYIVGLGAIMTRSGKALALNA